MQQLIMGIREYQKTDLVSIEKIKKYYEALSLTAAIQQASEARNPDGKINSHQRRIGRKKLSESALEMLKCEMEISSADSFEEIFEITESVRKRMPGLGDLWSYDTALRIGFQKAKYPEEVYVQRGVIKGVAKLLKGKESGDRSLPMSRFPRAIQQMQPYQAENFLCIWGKGKGGKISGC